MPPTPHVKGYSDGCSEQIRLAIQWSVWDSCPRKRTTHCPLDSGLVQALADKRYKEVSEPSLANVKQLSSTAAVSSVFARSLTYLVSVL